MEMLAKQSASREPVQPDERLLPGSSPYDLRTAFVPPSGWRPRGVFSSWPPCSGVPSEYGAGIWMLWVNRGLLCK
jgi:hypothetical protein